MSRMIIALILAIILGSSFTAQAEDREAPRLGITAVNAGGSYFDLTMQPGERRELTIRLGNYGTEETSARTYAADVYTILNGGFGAELAGESVSGVTTWLDYTDDVIALQPGEAVERMLSVTVPVTTEPGEYITSMVIQNAEPVKGSGGITLDVINRQAIAVAITVPGPQAPDLEVIGTSYEVLPAYPRVLVSLANTGNVHLRPTGEVVVRDGSGTELMRLTVAMDTFYAGTESALELILPQRLPAGDYAVTVSLEDEEHGVALKAVEQALRVEHDHDGSPTAEVPVVAIDWVLINEVRDPNSQAIQGIEVAAQISNPVAPLANAQMTLHVTRDGQLVEEHVLGSMLSFPVGSTEFRQRYVPLGGWTPGAYNFSVRLEAVEPNSGDIVQLAAAAAETSINVP